jgi:hypothetical protein
MEYGSDWFANGVAEGFGYWLYWSLVIDVCELPAFGPGLTERSRA